MIAVFALVTRATVVHCANLNALAKELAFLMPVIATRVTRECIVGLNATTTEHVLVASVFVILATRETNANSSIRSLATNKFSPLIFSLFQSRAFIKTRKFLF